MGAQVERGTIVYRRWDQNTGLHETEETFRSLDDLFELCLQSVNPKVVDRIILEGVTPEGARRTVVLTFQSTSGLSK